MAEARITLSVVIPARNSAATIGACLEHLAACGYPEERREVIVVDNGSSDETRRVVSAFPVRCLEEPRPGAAAARNRGAGAARGRLLGFVDADCLVRPDWLREAERSLAGGGGAAVVGRREHAGGALGRLEGEDYDRFWRRAVGPDRRAWALCGSNSAVRREAFAAAGGFDERLLCFEDVELGLRLTAAGLVIAYNPRMVVRHLYRDSLTSRMEKMRRHGYCEYLAFRKHERDERLARRMPAFRRAYFRALERVGSPRLLRLLRAAAGRAGGALGAALEVLLRHDVRLFGIYKAALNCALFEGKMAALEAERTGRHDEGPEASG